MLEQTSPALGVDALENDDSAAAIDDEDGCDEIDTGNDECEVCNVIVRLPSALISLVGTIDTPCRTANDVHY